jgi:hypothetical protein
MSLDPARGLEALHQSTNFLGADHISKTGDFGSWMSSTFRMLLWWDAPVPESVDSLIRPLIENGCLSNYFRVESR